MTRNITDPPAVVRAEEDLSAIAQRVRHRERSSRSSQLEHAKKQAADVLKARQMAKRGQWGPWCGEAGLGLTRAWHYQEFGKLSVTESFSKLTEDEQWAEWQRISGNSQPPEETEPEPEVSQVDEVQEPANDSKPTVQDISDVEDIEEARCKHGEWLKWLAANVRCSERRVHQYMAFAKSVVTTDLDAQWSEWQRCQGNAPPAEDAAATAVVEAEPERSRWPATACGRPRPTFGPAVLADAAGGGVGAGKHQSPIVGL